MKLLFLLFIALIISGVVYFFLSLVKRKAKKGKKFNWKTPLSISGVVFVILVGLVLFGAYASSMQPDLQCSSSHDITGNPPTVLKTAKDYFKLGNYEYDTGNCQKAIKDYSKTIEFDPNSAQAYNNRAYTNMRLRNYKDALPDLDKAIELNPNYVQALMNRGDIHNYYYQIDRQAAIADYKRVIAITGSSGGNTSVCGHLFLAKHNGWTLGAYIGFFSGEFRSCN